MDATPTGDRQCHGMLSNSRQIHGVLILTLVLLAAFLFAETIKSLKEYRYVGGGVTAANVISVTGQGEVFALPDTALFTFTVIEEGDTVSQVTEAAKGKVDAALAALKEKGVEQKDVKTIGYELSPKYEWQPVTCIRFPCDRKQVQKGFTLNQSIEVKVRKADSAGELLELVTSKGVQNVSGLSFTIDDEDALQAEARKAAIDEARAKAEKLASDLGVSLVRIVGFNEDGAMPYTYAQEAGLQMKAANDVAMNAAPQLPTGENRIVANVSISYEIR